MFSNAFNDPKKDPYSSIHYEYEVAVYNDLFIGAVYGEGHMTRRYSPIF